jgi:hypothetical protein
VEKKNKDNDSGKKKNRKGKGKGTEESNMGEEIAFTVDEECYNFDTFVAWNAEGNDEHLIFYDWLADSATTSHITHQWEAFTSYTSLRNSSVTRVGGNNSWPRNH